MGVYKIETLSGKKYLFGTLIEAEAFISQSKNVQFRKFKNGDIVIFTSDMKGKYITSKNFNKELEDLLNELE